MNGVQCGVCSVHPIHGVHFGKKNGWSTCMTGVSVRPQGRLKAEKNRLRVQEIFLKQTHQSRAEKAQAKREEKRRLEKERILEVCNWRLGVASFSLRSDILP